MEIIKVGNWIDNKLIEIEPNQKSIPVINPSDGSTVSNVPLSTQAQIEAAVQSAHKAFESWSSRTVKDRVQFLIRYHQLVIKNKDKLAALITLEHGKVSCNFTNIQTLEEALAEIAKGNETVEYALSLPQLILGNTLEVSRGVYCQDLRKPHGVVASIVPFNFPFMVPHWTLPIAIATGNTLIVKPSEKVPLTMTFAMELLKEAGVPDVRISLFLMPREW